MFRADLLSKLHCGLSSSLIRMWRRLDAVGAGAVAEWLVKQVQSPYFITVASPAVRTLKLDRETVV
jgi:hypothetical protein